MHEDARRVITIESTEDWHAPSLFMRAMGDAFSALGLDVLRLRAGDGLAGKLERAHRAGGVLLTLDFNLNSADLGLAGRPFHDIFGSWYVSTIDTPLNKVEKLAAAGDNLLLWLIDKDFAPFVRGVRGRETGMLDMKNIVLAGPQILADPPPLAERDIDVLFVGRFDPFPFATRNPVKRWLRRRMEQLTRDGGEAPFMDLLAAEVGRLPRPLRALLGVGSSLGGDFAWRLMHAARARRRLLVAQELAVLARGLRVVVVTGDALTPGFLAETCEVLPFTPWAGVLDLMRRARVVVNVEPLHRHAVHERMLAGMACGAAVATDGNVFQRGRFADGREVLFFAMRPGSLSGRIAAALADREALAEVAARGREAALSEFGAEAKARQLLAAVRGLPGAPWIGPPARLTHSRTD